MTTKRVEELEYERGYWVEFTKQRIAGGVSAQARNIEGGLGAVYVNEQFGITGYFQYALPFLQGRMQIDFTADQKWSPQLSFGIPLRWQQLKVEPHLAWPLEKDRPISPKLGLRMQYLF